MVLVEVVVVVDGAAVEVEVLVDVVVDVLVDGDPVVDEVDVEELEVVGVDVVDEETSVVVVVVDGGAVVVVDGVDSMQHRPA